MRRCERHAVQRVHCSRVFAELTTPSAPTKVASRNLIGVAATPPLRGGECSRSGIGLCTKNPGRSYRPPLQLGVRDSRALYERPRYISCAKLRNSLFLRRGSRFGHVI